MEDEHCENWVSRTRCVCSRRGWRTRGVRSRQVEKRGVRIRPVENVGSEEQVGGG